MFKDFSIFSSGGHLVYRSRTILAVLLGSHLGHIPMKFEQGWQKGGKYSYFPGRREILVIPGNYWEISYSLTKKLLIYLLTAIQLHCNAKIINIIQPFIK